MYFIILCLIPSAPRFPRYLYHVLKSTSLIISPPERVVTSLLMYHPHFIINIAHLLIPNFILISLLNILTVFTSRLSCFSVLLYNVRLPMNRRWFTLLFFLPSSYTAISFLKTIESGTKHNTKSSGETVSLWKISHLILTSLIPCF